MKYVKWLMAVVLVMFSVEHAFAQSSIEFTSGYPKSGAKEKIFVAGKITLDAGWTIKDDGPTVRFIPDGGGAGGAVRKQAIPRDGTTIKENEVNTMPALKAGAEYWVTMEITILDPCNKAYLISTVPIKKAAGK